MFDGSKNLFANVHWKYFSALEGMFRVLNLVVLKTIAKFLITPVLGFFITGLLGVVRLVAGAILTFRSGFAFYPNQKAVTGSLLVGLVTSYTTLVPIYVFVSADVSVVAFVLILIASFVPGALTAKFSSRGRLGVPQVLGLVFTVVGLWALVGFVSASAVPLWGWLLVSLPVASWVKEYIIKNMGTAAVISPWVHNIWVGLSMILFSLVTLIIFNVEILRGAYLENLSSYIWWVVLSGILFIATIFARQKSFRVMGGTFAKKKLVVIVLALAVAIIAEFFVASVMPVATMLIAGIILLLGYIISEGLILRNR